MVGAAQCSPLSEMLASKDPQAVPAALVARCSQRATSRRRLRAEAARAWRPRVAAFEAEPNQQVAVVAVVLMKRMAMAVLRYWLAAGRA